MTAILPAGFDHNLKIVTVGAHFETETDQDGNVAKIKMVGPTEFEPGSVVFDLLKGAIVGS